MNMTKLQYYRKKKNITQYELSKLSNISLRSIQNLEQGVNNINSCHLDTLIKFSELLGVRFTDLLEDEDMSRRVVKMFSADGSERAER